MKVFLDVGSNTGQTLSAIMEPTHGFRVPLFCRYGFEKIVSFEPVAELSQSIESQYRDPRISFLAAGLWKEDGEMELFSPGSEGASLFADKVNVDAQKSATCKFVRASDWFRDNLSEADEVYVKLNCEGAEVDIIEDLLDSREFRKVKSLGVTFDVKKIPSQRHRESQVRQRLADAGYDNVVDLNALNEPNFRDTIVRWLRIAGAEDPSISTRLLKSLYALRVSCARAVRYSRRRFGIGR